MRVRALRGMMPLPLSEGHGGSPPRQPLPSLPGTGTLHLAFLHEDDGGVFAQVDVLLVFDDVGSARPGVALALDGERAADQENQTIAEARLPDPWRVRRAAGEIVNLGLRPVELLGRIRKEDARIHRLFL